MVTSARVPANLRTGWISIVGVLTQDPVPETGMCVKAGSVEASPPTVIGRFRTPPDTG